MALLSLLLPFSVLAQVKEEQESRIAREQFPTPSLELLEGHLEKVRRLRFYEEIENAEKSYEAKFRKGRLHYSVAFDTAGNLQDVEFIISHRDIPNASWEAIKDHLDQNFPKYRIIKIQQHHPVIGGDQEKALREAFQNLILPHIQYEVVFSAKMEGDFQFHEARFDAQGSPIEIRRYLPLNYNHVLYD